MAGGRLQCVGTPGELRSKYGTGHVLQIVVPKESVEQVQTQVAAQFPTARLHEEHHGHMRFYLKAEDTRLLSQVYAALETIRAQFDGLSYHVAETSLEDVFLRFATRQKEAAANVSAAASTSTAGSGKRRTLHFPRLNIGSRRTYDLLAGDPEMGAEEDDDNDDEDLI